MRKTTHLAALLSLIITQANAQDIPTVLSIELNAQASNAAGCLLTFVISNGHPKEIESAVFETVLFNKAGQVDRLTLFDFGSLPAGRPRVRQFQIDGLACEDLGQALINGASSCKVAGADSPLCSTLKLSTRSGTALVG